jgi:alpha-amylase
MREDLVVETPDLFALIRPSVGGAVAEIDFKPSSFNISNVMTRRREEYHQKILDAAGKTGAGGGEILSIHDRVTFKEPGLEKKLVFDAHTRQSFADHITSEKPTVQHFRAGMLDERGNSASNYTVDSAEAKGGAAKIVLSRDAEAPAGFGASPLYVRKTYSVNAKEPGVTCEYNLTNRGKETVKFYLGVEWNFTLLAADALDRYLTVNGEKYRMNHSGETPGVKKWSMTDEYFRLRADFKCSQPVDFLRYPIETVSQSEDGFESNYQGTCMIAVVHVEVAPGKTAVQEFSISLTRL